MKKILQQFLLICVKYFIVAFTLILKMREVFIYEFGNYYQVS